MPVCNTVSLTLPLIFFSSFKWDFKWRIWSLPPLISEPGDVSTMYMSGEDVAAVNSSFCKGWSGAGGGWTWAAAPQLTARGRCNRSVSGPGWGRKRVGKRICFLGPLSIWPTKPAISSFVVGAPWKQRERDFSWTLGVLFWYILLALKVCLHICVCVCVGKDGFLGLICQDDRYSYNKDSC